MNRPRIIRPLRGEKSSGSVGVELNLEDVRDLSRQMVCEARQRVQALQDEQRAMEDGIRQRRAAEEQAAEDRRKELEGRRESFFEDIEKEREARLEAGRREGVEAGRREGVEAGRLEGYQSGYADGRQAGYREGREAEIERLREESRPLVATLTSLINECSVATSEMRQGLRLELIHLAVEIARGVIKREVRDFGSQIVLENVRQAVDLIFLRNRVSVQVHQDDLAVVEKYAGEVLETFAGLEEFEVRPVNDVAPGGCRVVAGSGIADLSLDVQLEAIEQALLDRGPAKEQETVAVTETVGEV